MPTRKQFFFLAMGATLVGCGGGEDFDPRAPITPRIRVQWPAIGRAFEATPYAMSVRAVISRASDNQEVVIIANRTGETAYEAVYAATEPILPGPVRMQVEFFADPNAQGRQLLHATEDVEPDRDGLLPAISMQNGTGAHNVLFLRYSTIVFGPQTIGARITLKLDTTPTDLFNSVGVNAEDLTFEIVSSEPELGPVLEKAPPTTAVLQSSEFRFTALRPGTATITATIGGVKSNAVEVTIVPPRDQ